MNNLENFLKIYDSIMRNYSEQFKIDNALFYQMGVQIVKTMKIEDAIKMDIINKLIYVFPNKSELYTFKANLSKNETEIITNHRMALYYDAKNRDSIIPLVNKLFEKGYYSSIFELNVNNSFDVAMDDESFLISFGRASMTHNHYVDTMKCLLQLLEYTKINITTQNAREMFWSYNNDIGYVYSAMAEFDKSIEHMNIAVDAAIKYKLKLPSLLMSFCNLMCYYSYGYLDNNVVYNRFLQINDFLPNQHAFEHHTRKPGNKIRIGYVSSDYLYHPVANFMIPIIENHSSQFEIFLYANQDFVEPMFEKLPAKLVKIKELSAMAAAKIIYDDHIDILFDLNGHTVNNRLDVFALNPAPIQIAYLGFPNTTGLQSIRYRITDSIADNPQTTQKYSESLLKMPRCFLLYKYIGFNHSISPKPTDPKCIILGAINKENKNSRLVLDTWSKILHACPNTKIMIKLETFDLKPERIEFYKTYLKVDESRLLLTKRMQNNDYDTIFQKIDILLDPFPYSGTTTSCNALYNSIPIITLYHRDYHAHNVTASLLIHNGMSELVTFSPDEYVEKACSLIRDTNRLHQYKTNVHTKFMETMNPCEFMKSYEDILIGVYQHELGLSNNQVDVSNNTTINQTTTNNITYVINEPKITNTKYSLNELLKNISVNNVGIEIGGPSITGEIIYENCNKMDNVVFSKHTIWNNYTDEYVYYKGKTGKVIVNDAVELSQIPDKIYDFCFSSHCLEHIANPLKAIYEWLRVIKDDGYLVIIVPEKSKCFDHKRSISLFSTLLGQYNKNVGEDDLSTLDEILENHDLSLDPPAGTFEQFKNRSLNNYSNRCLHHYVYSDELLKEICEFVNCEFIFTITINIDIWFIMKKRSV